MHFTPAPPLKLSICITTFNRASFIGATLESIATQMTNDCEIVVLDGGSTDDTEQVMSTYVRRFARLRYIRQQTNNGFDRDCDHVVEIARGEYCWLMTDDDLLKDGAVSVVLRALRDEFSLIVANVELRTFSMSDVLQQRWLDLYSDRTYNPGEMDHLAADVGHRLHYVGGIIVKRAIWLTREKERYNGSLFAYLWVIFQNPLPGKMLIIAEPLIAFRVGNTHTFSPKMFEVFAINYPLVVWSLALSDRVKSRVCKTDPWKSLSYLVWWRAVGWYSFTEYRTWIRPRLPPIHHRLAATLVALIPGIFVNALLVLYYSTSSRHRRGLFNQKMILQLLRDSCFYFKNWHVLRNLGHADKR